MKSKHGVDNPVVRAVTPAEPNVVQAPAAAANAPGQADAAQVADSEKTKVVEAQGGARRKTKKIKSKNETYHKYHIFASFLRKLCFLHET